jgi:hypothetical protein
MGDTLNIDLSDVLQDVNGSHVYSNNRATVGYLASSLHMLLPANIQRMVTAYTETHVDVKAFGKKNGVDNFLGQSGKDYAEDHPYIAYTNANERDLLFIKTAAMNYLALKDSGLDAKNAYLCAALRARWVVLGGYIALKEDPYGDSQYVEHRLVETDDDQYGDIVSSPNTTEVLTAMGSVALEFVAAHRDETAGAKFVTKNADSIWSCAEYLFRVRGHHFKNSNKEVASYTEFVKRYMNAANEGNFSWPEGVDMFSIFHTAIHPFKIKALVLMTAKFVSHGTIANSSIIRMSGSPVGVAVITTTAAALDTMKAETWWNAFNHVYGSTLSDLISFSKQVNDDKYGYHISAGLYGVERNSSIKSAKEGEVLTVEEAKSRVSAIAAAAQGLINALATAKESGMINSFALSNAKALNKAADANPMLSIRINSLVIKALEEIDDAGDMRQAISAALPQFSFDGEQAK